jgi:hypothetical protein
MKMEIVGSLPFKEMAEGEIMLQVGLNSLWWRRRKGDNRNVDLECHLSYLCYSTLKKMRIIFRERFGNWNWSN